MNILFRNSLVIIASLGISLALPGSGTLFAEDLSCSDITWKPEAINQFPDVVKGCKEIIVEGDRVFARFEAILVRARITTGEIKIRILLPNGKQVERTFNAPSNFMVNTSGGGTQRIFDLERGVTMDILISENSFSVTSADERSVITFATTVSDRHPPVIASN